MSHDTQAVLDFWFDQNHAAYWYKSDAAFDQQIRARFGTLFEQAVAGELDDWAATPTGWLALLILLDQFSRNLYRNDARAWAQDVKAQRLALSGLASGMDQSLSAQQRVFAYMPLEHAENIELQHQVVQLFETLREQVPEEQRAHFGEYVDYARRHREVIARFGRFPHRNALLGRASTADEKMYLAQPGAGF
jgi:uncharacterized protein (DUF924 family)